MLNPVAKFKELRIHFEKPVVLLKRTVLATAVIALTSAAVFGIDTAVSSILSLV